LVAVVDEMPQHEVDAAAQEIDEMTGLRELVDDLRRENRRLARALDDQRRMFALAQAVSCHTGTGMTWTATPETILRHAKVFETYLNESKETP
jgi:hypothetical protein